MSTSVCVKCGRVASKTCSVCNGPRYCSRTCQEADWPDHEKTCGGASAVGNGMYETVVPFTDSDYRCLAQNTGISLTIATKSRKVIGWRCGMVSDIGGRKQQQDNGRFGEIRSSEDPRDVVFFAVVCDGHGTPLKPPDGAPKPPDGATASAIAMDTIFGLPRKYMATRGTKLGTSPTALSRFFNNAARVAHERMASISWTANGSGDAGTTMCAAAVPRISDEGKLTVVNVGDSQAMLLDSVGELKVITAPHKLMEQFPESSPTFQQKLVDDHSPDLDMSRCAVDASRRFGAKDKTSTALAMTRAIGHTHLAAKCGVLPRPTVYEVTLADGDLLVVASDGFWDYYLPNFTRTPQFEQLRADLKNKKSIEAIVKEVVVRMGERCDNVTAIVVRFHVQNVVMY